MSDKVTNTDPVDSLETKPEGAFDPTDSTIVKLNVGGTLFETTRSTLTRHSHYFRTLLSCDENGMKYSNANADHIVFIDRDPYLFTELLRYFRNANYRFETNSFENLKAEFDYFLVNMPQQLTTALKQSAGICSVVMLTCFDDDGRVNVLGITPEMLASNRNIVSNSQGFWYNLIQSEAYFLIANRLHNLGYEESALTLSKGNSIVWKKNQSK